LATVGDELVGAFHMQNKYKYNSSMGELTKAKKALKNINLNSIGQKLCGEHLFATNNDLNEKNNKSYATSFEAIIGFILLFDLTSAKRVFDEYMK
jgi:dsRNA-specific ribonuclease